LSALARKAILFGVTLTLMACAPRAPGTVPPVLLFGGTGTTPKDVAAVETILKHAQLAFTTVNSGQLNAMSDSELVAYRLMIVPGGNFIAMAESLAPATTTRIHNSVQGGLNYLGICAGGFLAARGTYNSFDLASGARFGFYSAERQGIRKAAVAIATVNAPPVEHYWEDGPEFTGWGAVVGKYPDGTPAIVEGSSGKGWVVLAGVHPEAPESWRRGMTFTSPATVANAQAATLVTAALNRTLLPHY
jgi:glutamine amidotransferase-like uncharacterized protein